MNTTTIEWHRGTDIKRPRQSQYIIFEDEDGSQWHGEYRSSRGADEVVFLRGGNHAFPWSAVYWWASLPKAPGVPNA